MKKSEHIRSLKICMDNESEWITKDKLNVWKKNEWWLESPQTKPISNSPLTWQWMEISKVSSENDCANGTASWFCSVWKMDLKWRGVRVYLKLTVIKSLQVKWLWQFSYYIKSSDSRCRSYQNWKHIVALSK